MGNAESDLYEGESKDGKRHGNGIQKWPDESQYEGQWNYDK